MSTYTSGSVTKKICVVKHRKQTSFTAPGLSRPYGRQQRLTLIVSWSIFPHYLTTTTFPLVTSQWWMTGTTTSPDDNDAFPSSLYDNKYNDNSPFTTSRLMTTPFHHKSRFITSMTYDDFSPSPHNSPIPLPSLLPRRVSMSTWQEDSLAGEQVCTRITWWHVSPKHPSWLMWLQLTPVILQQQTNHHRITCINWQLVHHNFIIDFTIYNTHTLFCQPSSSTLIREHFPTIIENAIEPNMHTNLNLNTWSPQRKPTGILNLNPNQKSWPPFTSLNQLHDQIYHIFILISL